MSRSAAVLTAEPSSIGQFSLQLVRREHKALRLANRRKLLILNTLEAIPSPDLPFRSFYCRSRRGGPILKTQVFYPILLGAGISLMSNFLLQWFQVVQQQSFQRELTTRQQDFQRELTTRQERFQDGVERKAIRRAKLDRCLVALENYASAHTKGSTQIFIHVARLRSAIGKLTDQPAPPSYEAAIDIANKYEQIVNEMNNWLGDVGPRQSVLEILAGQKGPAGEFTSLPGLSEFIDKNDANKRKDVLVLMKREVGQLQTAIFRNVEASTAFMESVQKSLTDPEGASSSKSAIAFSAGTGR